MKKRNKTVLAIVIGVLMGWMSIAASLAGAMAEEEDKTLSPYFMVNSDDPLTDRLPLKSTQVKADVSGVIADVAVTQVYENIGNKPLEAVYVFPASTKAAVYGMKMTIGERIIVAEIKEKEQARRDYEDAKNAGKSASLLEQHRPNVFQMQVANILPGDVISVELKYTELLVPTDAVYEFAYPTVVGPRYMGMQTDNSSTNNDHWAANPYLHQGKSPQTTLGIAVNLNAGLPIRDISCTTHPVEIAYKGDDSAAVKINPKEKYTGNRDFILHYRLAGDRIETGLLLASGEKENFFLMMLQPPKRIKADQIPPREYMFIVDVSGSMHGFPLDTAKVLLKDLIGRLRPDDRFNVLLFSGSARVMSENALPATSENIQKAIEVIDREQGGGGTELLPALKKALDMEGDQKISRTLIIVTDGYVTVEEEAFDLIRNRLGEANLFAFGIGSSVNRHLIEGMARAGMGEPFVITRPEDAPEKAENFRKLVESPVLTDISLDYGDFDVYDVEPPAIPDVLANRPVIVFGKWRGKARGTLHVRGQGGKGPFSRDIRVEKFTPDPGNKALKYLWARHRIEVLSDYNSLRADDGRSKTIIDLGLTYNLLTAYTSFIAVDSRIRLENGKAVTVKQPLPLPLGVSDYALGGEQFAAKSMAAPIMGGSFMSRQEVLSEGDSRNDKAREPEKKNKSMGIEQISVSTGYSEAKVRKIIEKHLQDVQQCCQGGPGGCSGFGKMTLKMVVDGGGRVTRLEIIIPGSKDDTIQACMRKILEKINFPAPVNTGTADITIVLIF
jgi:Ca-activated chloride channel homolog